MSNTNEIMAKIKEYGRRRYEQGVKDGRMMAEAEARSRDRMIRDAVNEAYMEGKRDAERIAADNEERFEADVAQLKEELMEERKRKPVWR